VTNNNTDINKNNELPESDIDEHGKGVLLFLVGLMVLLALLMVNSYQVPTQNLNTDINSKNESSPPTNEIVNTSEKSKTENRKVISSNVRMI